MHHEKGISNVLIPPFSINCLQSYIIVHQSKISFTLISALSFVFPGLGAAFSKTPRFSFLIPFFSPYNKNIHAEREEIETLQQCKTESKS